MNRQPTMRQPVCLFFFVLGCLACVGMASPAVAQLGKPEGLYYKSWAIIIGIDDYLIAPKLEGGVADGKALAASLKKLGFEELIEVYNKDASSKHLKMLLEDFLPRKVGRQDRVVIFFSGHAGVTTDMDGKDLGYLVPYDATLTAVSKAVTLDQLKATTRRLMSKHVVFLINAPISGWEVSTSHPLSLEGRLSPEEDTERRVIQLLAAAPKGETLHAAEGHGAFVSALLEGFNGAADLDKNGWLMGTELGDYVSRRVQELTANQQHPQYARLDGEGDVIFVEGKKSAFRMGAEPKTEAQRIAAAKLQYDQAFSALQQQRPTQEALEFLERALSYYPAYGDAYVLQSYLYLELKPDLDKALAAGELAVKYAPANPDSFFTLGLIYQKMGRFQEAEQALVNAVRVNPQYNDVYLSLGDLYAQDLKDQPKAIAAYQRYLETGGNENRAKDFLVKAGAYSGPVKQ